MARKRIASDADITAIDIVEYAVKLLEDEPLFNAGKGAVFTADETHELEASIMDGSNLKVQFIIHYLYLPFLRLHLRFAFQIACLYYRLHSAVQFQ